MRGVGSAARPASWIARTLFVATIVAGSAVSHADDLALGDAAWERRAEGSRQGQPSPTPIGEAVEAYERALAARPESLEARWKLLRALHFAGEFVHSEESEKRRVFTRARELSETGISLLAERVSPSSRLEETRPAEIASRLEAAGVEPSEGARLYFWSAIVDGSWSRTVGLLDAVRNGVANRMFDYARVAIALEPGCEQGGALRLLARMHAKLPRVPFVSPWVDRDRAVPLMEQAHALAPSHPGNGLLLALTILELAPDRRAEALALLEGVAESTPRSSMQIEDFAIRREARERLAAERGERVD